MPTPLSSQRTATESTESRRYATLHHALGPDIQTLLDDPTVVEIMANANGGLWVDRIGSGQSLYGEISEQAIETVIRLVAAAMDQSVSAEHPMLSGVLPRTGERFQGMLRPISNAPCFAIRKPARVVYTIDDYVAAKIMTSQQGSIIRDAIAQKLNIVVAGGTGSGKTTLLNGCLGEPAFCNERIIVIEDTHELHCSAPNCVHLMTRIAPVAEQSVTMRELVRSTLRLRPDRIVVGEVRGGEALDMLKVWNTGHPGGLTTLHANSAEDAMLRLDGLIGEVVERIPRQQIASAIDLIVFIRRDNDHPAGRQVTELKRIEGFSSEGYQFSCPV